MKTKFAIFYLLSSIFAAHADLTAVVTPGYTFSSTERADTSKLNRLGNPSIVITGTVGGTNAGIGATTLNGTMMVDTFVDGTNITWNTASPRRLKIVDGGVGVTQISSNIAGQGLTGGGGTNLNVAVHTNGWLSIYNDQLSLTTNGVPVGALTMTSNTIPVGYSNNAPILAPLPNGWSFNGAALRVSETVSNWQSFDYSLASGVIASTNHIWSNSVPNSVRWVLVCATSEFSYSIGDVVPVESVRGTSENLVLMPGWNATNVFLLCKSSTTLEVLDRSDGTTLRTLTAANWRARCYARP